MDLKKERRIAAAIKGGTWADGNVGGEDAEGLWSPAGSTNTFLADITAGKKALKGSGILANCLIVDFATFMALKEADAITNKIKYTSSESITPQLLARILELDEVLVGKAVYSDAEENIDDSAFNSVDIWEVNPGKGMGFLFYRPPKLGLKILTAGVQVRIAYENGEPRRTCFWREGAEHQDVYEVAEETAIEVICADAGYLWKDTYAT